MAASVERSPSIARAAAQHSSFSSQICPCVTLVGVISANSGFRSEESDMSQGNETNMSLDALITPLCINNWSAEMIDHL